MTKKGEKREKGKTKKRRRRSVRWGDKRTYGVQHKQQTRLRRPSSINIPSNTSLPPPPLTGCLDRSSCTPRTTPRTPSEARLCSLETRPAPPQQVPATPLGNAGGQPRHTCRHPLYFSSRRAPSGCLGVFQTVRKAHSPWVPGTAAGGSRWPRHRLH